MSDLDLPLLPSAEQIRRRRFATVRRGYDPDQVTEYLNQIAIQVETLEGEIRDERMKASAAGRPDAAAAPPAAAAPAKASVEAAYAELAERFAASLRAADEESKRVVADAKVEAAKMLEEARTQAEAIRVDAQASADEARAKSAEELARARAEADRVVGGLERRREAMLAQMHEMQSRLLAVAQDLDVPEDAPGGAHVAPAATGSPAPTQASPAPTQGTPAQAQGAHASAGPAPVAAPSPGAQASGAAKAAAPTPPRPTPPAPSAPAPQAAPAPVGSTAGRGEDDVDPRYEDLWAPSDAAPVELPDLSAIDIDFDDEQERQPSD